jgi:hypothetical protein
MAHRRPTSPLILAAALLAVALSAGGGYALASTANRARVIHGCVEARARVLLVKPRCGRGQLRLTWNEQGPAGPRGAVGPAGPAGPSPIVVAGEVGVDGTVGGAGVSVQHTVPGEYVLTLTQGQCTGLPVIPTVTAVYGGNGATTNPAFPVAAAITAPGPTFTVRTGVLGSNGFTQQDEQFYFQVACQTQ